MSAEFTLLRDRKGQVLPLDDLLDGHVAKVGDFATACFDRCLEPEHLCDELALSDTLASPYRQRAQRKPDSPIILTRPRIVSITVPTSPVGIMILHRPVSCRTATR